MHHVLHAQDIKPKPEYAGHSAGFLRARLTDGSEGAVHTALGKCALAENGSVDTHVHSFEEFFYILEGSPVLVLDGHAHELAPGACGVVPVGVPHAWRGPRKGNATWIDMLTPLPRLDGKNPDTFFLGAPAAGNSEPLDIRDPRSRYFFRMTGRRHHRLPSSPLARA